MTDLKRTVTEAAENALVDVMAAQPWWRQHANTVTAAATGVGTMGAWLLTTDLGLPAWVQAIVGVLVGFAGVVATRATKNGVTPRGNKDVIGAVVPAITDALTPKNTMPGLDELIARQGSAAADAAVKPPRPPRRQSQAAPSPTRSGRSSARRSTSVSVPCRRPSARSSAGAGEVAPVAVAAPRRLAAADPAAVPLADRSAAGVHPVRGRHRLPAR